MARTPKTPPAPAPEPKKTAAPPKSANALVPWEEQLARDAEIAATAEANAGGGQFFSFKAGQLSFNGTPVPNNQMAVVIVDTVFENVFYEGEYNPAVIMPPTCFAFGREELTLAPHETVVERKQDQHNNCQGCPMNGWGTADKGRGKACRNTRRLGVIPAGDFSGAHGKFVAFDDEEQFAKAPVGFMKLPVTSVKGYANFVKQVAVTLKRPPHGIFARVSVTPDAQTQFKVVFEPLGLVPNHLMQTVMNRRQETMAIIAQPYNLDVEAEAPASAGRGRASPVPNKRPPVKGGKKKY